MAKEKSVEFGICKVCGNYKILTEEHIPPKSAFNNGRYKLYSGDEILKTLNDSKRLPWNFDGLKYKIKQGGFRLKTLCSKCNSYFGTNYVNEYQNVVKSFAFFLSEINIDKTECIHATTDKFKPLPFIKEIIAMFASLTNIATYPEIKNFLLDKHCNKFKKDKFRIYMSISKGNIQRTSNWSILFSTKGRFIVSEIVTFPFIFVLLGNADEQPPENTKHFGTDITSFVDFKYNDETTLEISLPIHECNINLPCDYRTKEEIENCKKQNIENKNYE